MIGGEQIELEVLGTLEHEKDANTVRNYKDSLEGHVLPELGHLKVRELHRGHIKASSPRSATGAKNTVERIQKVRPMTWEQRDALLTAAAAEPRYTTLFSLLAKTGVRPGEGFALEPGDIDWNERTVRVERAWNLGRVKPTKTYEDRTVDLTPELVEALARHMTWLKAEAQNSASPAMNPDRGSGVPTRPAVPPSPG